MDDVEVSDMAIVKGVAMKSKAKFPLPLFTKLELGYQSFNPVARVGSTKWRWDPTASAADLERARRSLRWIGRDDDLALTGNREPLDRIQPEQLHLIVRMASPFAVVGHPLVPPYEDVTLS